MKSSHLGAKQWNDKVYGAVDQIKKGIGHGLALGRSDASWVPTDANKERHLENLITSLEMLEALRQVGEKFGKMIAERSNKGRKSWMTRERVKHYFTLNDDQLEWLEKQGAIVFREVPGLEFEGEEVVLHGRLKELKLTRINWPAHLCSPHHTTSCTKHPRGGCECKGDA